MTTQTLPPDSPAELSTANLDLALRLLGENVDEVARTLIDGGHKGIRAEAESCPIANYLVDRFGLEDQPGHQVNVDADGAYIATYDTYRGSGWGEPASETTVILTDATAEFIQAFDTSTKWPELDELAAQPPAPAEFDESQVVSALAELPGTPAEIGKFLFEGGFKGLRGESCKCPVANFVAARVGARWDEVLVGLDSVHAYTEESETRKRRQMFAVPHSPGVAAFVQDFDRGVYPQLELRGGQ